MERFKKIVSVLLALIICFSVAACKQEEEEPQIYTISFETNGGNDEDDIIYVVGEFTDFPYNTAKEGYVLKGWYDNPQLTGTAYWYLMNETEPSPKFYAKWELKNYNTIFNLSNSNVVLPEGYERSTYTMEDGPIIIPDGISTKEHYEFAGWYTNAERTGAPVFKIEVGTIGNINLWPKLAPIGYSVTLSRQDGSLIQEVPFDIESDTITLPTDITAPDHYTFGGWWTSTGAQATQVTAIPAGSYGDRTYFVRWNAIPYEIEYNLNSGSWAITADYPETYIYNAENATYLAAPERSGHRFAGWHQKSDLSDEPIFVIPAGKSGKLELYAAWEAAAYTITYNLNGGVNPGNAPQGYNSGESITLPTPWRNGYAFDGWYDNEQLSGMPVVSIGAGESGAKQYWAAWVFGAYSVILDTNSGTAVNPSAFFTNYEFGQGKLLPTENDLQRTGYEFDGWYLDGDFTGDPVTAITDEDFGNKTFVAKWNLINYSLVVNANGGRFTSGVATITVNFTIEDTITIADVVSAIPNPAGVQYIFTGWWSASNGTGTNYQETFVEAGVLPNGMTLVGDKLTLRVYAGWRDNYSITYLDSNGSQLAAGSMPVEYATTYSYNSLHIVTLPVPTKAGFTFGGWVETINPTAAVPVGQRFGTLRPEYRDNVVGDFISGSGDHGDKTFYALWLNDSVTTQTREMLAVDTNLAGVNGPGYSGSQIGWNRRQTAVPSRSTKGYVGWTHTPNTVYVTYEFTLDRIVSNATLEIGLGVDPSIGGNVTFFYNDSMDVNNPPDGYIPVAILVNGVAINWGSTGVVGVGQFGSATVSGVTLLPGKNTVEIMPLDSKIKAGGNGAGPLIDYIVVTANANIGFKPENYFN